MRGHSGTAGLSLVEVLIALAVLGVMGLALLGLQAGSLRAARGSVATRELAGALRGVAALARLVDDDAAACVPASGFDCAVDSACLTAPATAAAGCDLRRVRVTLVRHGGGPGSPSGTPNGATSGAVTTVVYAPLEAAPVGVDALTGVGSPATTEDAP